MALFGGGAECAHAIGHQVAGVGICAVFEQPANEIDLLAVLIRRSITRPAMIGTEDAAADLELPDHFDQQVPGVFKVVVDVHKAGGDEDLADFWELSVLGFEENIVAAGFRTFI